MGQVAWTLVIRLQLLGIPEDRNRVGKEMRKPLQEEGAGALEGEGGRDEGQA